MVKMRKALVVGNWKMNGVRSDATDLAAAIKTGFEDNGAEIAVCVPSVYFSEIGSLLAGTSILLGSQNVAEHDSGAYTGEISAKMLNDFNCHFAIVGHSERRSYYNDSNESVARRYNQSLSQGITPILCVGETLEQRESNETFTVIDQQLDAVIDLAGIESFAKAVIAYEPVWAIGTGKVATDDQAQEVHAYIRNKLAQLDAGIAENMQILYGGSVKPGNATALFAMPDIDGGLIGGASLDGDAFLSIYQSTK
jgi:triosephosphate isomerase